MKRVFAFYMPDNQASNGKYNDVLLLQEPFRNDDEKKIAVEKIQLMINNLVGQAEDWLIIVGDSLPVRTKIEIIS